MNKDEANLQKGDKLYYARIIPKCGIYDVLDMKVSAIYDTYFAVTENRDKHRYLFSFDNIDKVIFKNRKHALNMVLDAEKNNPKASDETFYEEY